ncbi:MAG: DNA alkylation repair protein [Acidobacteria bacterium]|nr:MAG: DNA alkylation repair protein [Acidobacteriota bacterium]
MALAPPRSRSRGSPVLAAALAVPPAAPRPGAGSLDPLRPHAPRSAAVPRTAGRELPLALLRHPTRRARSTEAGRIVSTVEPRLDDLLRELRSLAREGAVEGMARYGIRSADVIGVAAPDLRRIARRLGTDDALARALWATGIHDARVLATMLADPARTTPARALRWAKDLDNWAVCDALCLCLLVRLPFAHELSGDWAQRPEEFVRRASFSLLACLAVHDEESGDEPFREGLARAEAAASDGRTAVRKAVNWALRQIGKRNPALNAAAVAAARRIREQGTPTARWIASDALRELTSDAVAQRLARRHERA